MTFVNQLPFPVYINCKVLFLLRILPFFFSSPSLDLHHPQTTMPLSPSSSPHDLHPQQHMPYSRGALPTLHMISWGLSHTNMSSCHRCLYKTSPQEHMSNSYKEICLIIYPESPDVEPPSPGWGKTSVWTVVCPIDQSDTVLAWRPVSGQYVPSRPKVTLYWPPDKRVNYFRQGA